jgi:hypothetical protein
MFYQTYQKKVCFRIIQKPTFSSYAIFTFRCAGICQASRPEGLRTGSFATDGHRKYMKECSTCDGAGAGADVLLHFSSERVLKALKVTDETSPAATLASLPSASFASVIIFRQIIIF